MDDEIVLTLSCPPVYRSRQSAEALSLSLLKQARSCGGSGWAAWTGHGLIVRLHDVASDDLQPIVRAWVDAAQREGESLGIVQQRKPAEPLPDATGEIPWGTIVHARLTKKLLNQVPQRAWVISNCYGRGGEPIFEQRLGPPETREAAWALAVSTGANNRVCRVAWTSVELDGPELPDWLLLPVPER